jgi:hypothetical protein
VPHRAAAEQGRGDNDLLHARLLKAVALAVRPARGAAAEAGPHKRAALLSGTPPRAANAPGEPSGLLFGDRGVLHRNCRRDR